MLAKLMQLLEKLTGVILGGLAVSIQFGNALICIFILVLGPAFVIGLLGQ
jgi:hypothetical protein